MDRLTELIEDNFRQGIHIDPCEDGNWCVSTTRCGREYRTYNQDILTALEELQRKVTDDDRSKVPAL